MSTNTEKVTTTAGTGTAAEWTTANPVLLSGEWGKETDTGKMKNGDGVTAWNSLTYSVIPDIDSTLESKASKTGPQICKAWVCFDGTGTVSIRDSYNVSSITDNGTGTYTVNLSTAREDANFCVLVHSGPLTFASESGRTTSSVSIQCLNHLGALTDSEYVNVAIF